MSARAVVWNRRTHGLLAACLLPLVLAGCGKPARQDPPDDEAMVRARSEGLTAERAAREYFYPRHLENYFAGMDQIAAPAGSTQQDAVLRILSEGRVDQLLDRPEVAQPERVLLDPVATPSEVLGRNTWMIWCGGNEGFWDWLANNSLGFLDLLKLLDSRERTTRFDSAGLINEPEMEEARAPEEQAFGLWLDIPADARRRAWREAYLERVFEPQLHGEGKIEPGYAQADGESGARYSDAEAGDYDLPGEPPPEVYGLSSGVVGLRLFPNPNFDAAARKRWDPKRYYQDPDYYNDPELVRPFRVGMSCAFCHASYHPLDPPVDLTNPGWENISGNIGAQYLRIRAVFGNLLTPDNFVYHLLDSQPPGTIDTSLIASDNINNPNAMNSVFNVPQRVVLSLRTPKEDQAAVSLTQPSLWGNPRGSGTSGYGDGYAANGDDAGGAYSDDTVPEVYRSLFASLGLEEELRNSNSDPRRVPRILLDGADSIGAWGALARVYLNIGTYYEQWIRLHTPLVGFTPQKPFTIDDSEAHSVYWHATQDRVAGLRDYFLKISPPMPLLEAGDVRQRAGGELEKVAARRIDVSRLARGRQVFAHNCIVCHSSIQPPERFAAMQRWADQGEYWDHDPGQWLRDPDYIAWAEAAVETPEFWRNNYLSTDYRIPINLVRTNAGRALATNALSGNMWEDFASESYRHLPSVGAIEYFNPYQGENGGTSRFTPRHRVAEGVPQGGGGPGFYRVPTLVSIWATAPLLHNNSLGLFNNDPSVGGRVAAFDDAIRKLLWPARRLRSSSFNGATAERLRRDHGLIWRTPQKTYLEVPAKFVPPLLLRVPVVMRAVAFVRARLPWLEGVSFWLPSGLLFALAVVLLLIDRHRWVRWAGLGALCAAVLVALLLALLQGKIGELRLGPIPEGTPVNLIANVNPDADPSDLRRAVQVTLGTLADIESRHLDPDEAAAQMRERVAPALLAVSRVPDFVMDHGHYYEWFDGMSDADKDALIELLKTF